MAQRRNTADAVEILRRRYIGDDLERRASLDQEHLNAEVAQMIYDYRTEAGLNQKELAELIGTTQSVISRLESAEYEGHSLSMLDRIAKALNRRVSVEMPPRDPEASDSFAKLTNEEKRVLDTFVKALKAEA